VSCGCAEIDDSQAATVAVPPVRVWYSWMASAGRMIHRIDAAEKPASNSGPSKLTAPTG
jgi:hypothetical protein